MESRKTGTSGDVARVMLALLALGLALTLIGAQCGCTLHVHLWGKYTIERGAARQAPADGAEQANQSGGQDARGNQGLLDEAERIVTDGE